MAQTQYLVLLHYRFKNKLVISVHVVFDIISNRLIIPRDVGSHTNTKHQVFSCLTQVKTILYLDSLHLMFCAEQIIKQNKMYRM